MTLTAGDWRHKWPGLALMVMLIISGCAQQGGARIDPPLRAPIEPTNTEHGAAASESTNEAHSAVPDVSRQQPAITRIRVPGDWADMALLTAEQAPLELPTGPFDLSLEAMPLPAFINEVFGRMLGLSFQMDPQVQSASDLVTLRLEGARSGDELYGTAIRVLGSFGIQARLDGDSVRFIARPEAERGEVPLLSSGRALPSVAASHRPIFHLVPLQSVRNAQVRNLLLQMFARQDLQILEDGQRNAVILQGPPGLVRQALEAVEVFDQPHMRGRNVLRIDPIWRGAGDLAAELISLLAAQGFEASSRVDATVPTIVLALDSINAVLVFTVGERVLDQVEQWARELDVMEQALDEVGLFRYAVRNVTARSITDVLQGLLGGESADRSPEGLRDQREPEGAAQGRFNRSGLVVDEPRNAILFQGTGGEWQRLRRLIESMDVPTRSVLIEVTVAEITLSEDFSSGVDWVVNNARLGRYGGQLGTEGGLSLGGRGLTWFPTSAGGNFSATLQAFAGTDRVSILSTPRIVVRSGEEADLTVGSEIPVVTGEAVRPDLQQDGTSGLFRSVALRRTGVLLNIRPIIHAGNRIDLEIRQEVSEARQTDTSGIDSPTILERSISTSLSLRDGGEVMLGGLISQNESEAESRVPGLGRVPLLGRLFRTESRSSDRTELVILIVPYILDDYEDSERITEEFRRRLAPEHPASWR